MKGERLSKPCICAYKHRDSVSRNSLGNSGMSPGKVPAARAADPETARVQMVNCFLSKCSKSVC